MPSQEEERRRTLFAMLAAGRGAVILDNVKVLEGEALSCCLTQTYFEDRVIRTSKLQRVPNRGLWLATGNDPSLTPEIAGAR